MKRIFAIAIAASLSVPAMAPAQSPYYRRSPTAGNAGTLVRTDYERYLHREPGPDASTWIQDLRTGSMPNDVLAGILSSDEYYAKAGGTRPDYVRRLYVDVLGREPLPAEINYWVGRLHYESPGRIAHIMLRHHPRSGAVLKAPPPTYDPGFFPDPNSPTFRDPGGPYFHSPYFFNYEKSRGIRAFMLNAQG